MKTPEEIKRGLECCETVECDDCPYAVMLVTKYGKTVIGCQETVTQDTVAYIKQLEAQVPRWIPVIERLPEDGKDVLVLIRGIVDVGFHFAQYGWETYTMRTVGITHWMPLPEPPKEVQHATD